MSESTKSVLKKAHSRVFQNTYRLGPKQYFDIVKIQAHIKNIMELNLKEVEYSEDVMKDIIITMTQEIHDAVKSEQFDRFRFVVTVMLGQKKMQGVHVNHSFLWDHEKDKYAEYVYENNSFFVLTVVYGVYLD